MIQENELRIGNIVTDQFFDSFKNFIIVKSMNNEGINLEIADDGNYPECASYFFEPDYLFGNIFGIPLTPSILEKCGFEKDNENERFQLDTDLGLCIYGSIELGVAVNMDYKIVGNAVKHLHQLQNLYFALTGEELIFNN